MRELLGDVELGPNRRRALYAICAATLFGLLHLWATVPLGIVLASDPLWRIPFNDVAMNVLGAEAFLQDTVWHFPLAVTSRLQSGGQPVSILYTDSAPWIAILLKALGFRADQISAMGVTAVLAVILQPIAFALLLLALGVRRIETLLIGIVLGALLPAWYFRMVWHIALASHWLIVLALAFAVLAIRRGLSWWTAAGLAALGALSLGIHPYLFVMVAIIAGGALLTDVARSGVAAAPRAVAGLAMFLLSAMLSSRLLMSGAGGGVDGFGRFSMNLLSPFVPQQSAVMKAMLGHPGRILDATGGQYEGYAYVGAGVLLCGGLAVFLFIRHRPHADWRAIAPLMLALLALTTLAVSNKVYLGPFLVLDVPVPAAIKEWLDVVRSSGRMVWPVVYMALAWTMLMLDRAPRRIPIGLFMTVALGVQIVDTVIVRRALAQAYRPNPALAFDSSSWRKGGKLAGLDLQVLPAYLCTIKGHEPARQAAIATIRSGGTVSDGPIARFDPALCDRAALCRTASANAPHRANLLMAESLPADFVASVRRSGKCSDRGSILLCDPSVDVSTPLCAGPS